jgi:hypothetical protein
MQMFWGTFGIAVAVAFVIGWREQQKSVAYSKALYAGTAIVFLPSCIPMFVQNPVEANHAAESFFWMLPLYLLWFVAGPVAVAYARLLKSGDN